MKARALIVLSVFSLIILSSVPTPAQAEGIWSITASPNFIFSGDSFNVTVTGQSSSFVILNARFPNGTIFQDLSSFTDELGVVKFTIAVPLESISGIYILELVSTGVIMANATVEIVKNDINWLYNLHLQDQTEIDRLNKIVYPLRTKVAQLEATLADQWIYIIITVAYAALVTIIMLFMFKPWMEWRAMRNPGSGTMVRSTKNVLHPPPESEFEHIDGVVASRTMLLERQLDDKESKTYLVRASLKGEPREVDEVEEVKVDKAKVVIPAGKGFEVKDAEVERSRRSLFRGRRRVKSVKVLPVKQVVQEAPEPPVVSRKAPPKPRSYTPDQLEAEVQKRIDADPIIGEMRKEQAKKQLRAVHEAQGDVVPKPAPRPRPLPEPEPEVEPTEWDEPDVIDEMLAKYDEDGYVKPAPVVQAPAVKPLTSLYKRSRDQVQKGART